MRTEIGIHYRLEGCECFTNRLTLVVSAWGNEQTVKESAVSAADWKSWRGILFVLWVIKKEDFWDKWNALPNNWNQLLTESWYFTFLLKSHVYKRLKIWLTRAFFWTLFLTNQVNWSLWLELFLDFAWVFMVLLEDF